MNTLKSWVAKLSIQQKLIYSNMLGIAFAFLPIVFIMLTYEYFSLRNAILQEIRIQAAIIGESSSAAMAFRDNESAHETLSSLKGAKDLIEAHLVLADGTILESYYADAKSSKPNTTISVSKVATETISPSAISLKKPIYLRSEFVGSLIIVSSLDTFYTRLSWYAFFILFTTAIGFLLARFVATRISTTITGPLSSLIVATQRIMRDKDYSLPLSVTSSQDEVGSLSNAFSDMMSQIRKRDLSLQQLAYYDRITEIPNRHYFEERIAQAVDNAERYGTTCYLLMIDLDDFKIVNDTLGHNIGDDLLRYVSATLKSTMRQNDSIFRIGGDEFSVLVESASDHEAVERIAQKIIAAVSTPVKLDGHDVKVGASVGVSCYPKFATNVRTLMSTADVAMYVAKRKGKNTYQLYSESFQTMASH